MYDPVARLNAVLSGRYAIERELGDGGWCQGEADELGAPPQSYRHARLHRTGR